MRTCRLVYCIERLWWMSIDTHLVCTDWMVIASTNYQTGHSGVAFATLAACLGSFWAGRLLKKLNEKRQQRADFVRFATAALSSQSAPANYDKVRLLGLHGCRNGFYSERFVFWKVVFRKGFYSERFLLRKFGIKTFRKKKHSEK